MSLYPKLFSPLNINAMRLENRVLMAPMAVNFAGPGGEVTECVKAYYAERARGGTGLLIVENANIDFPLGVNGAVQLRIDEDRFIPGLGTLREAIYDANPAVKAALQLNHPGGQTKAIRTGGRQVVGPSDVVTRPGGEVPRPLTIEEIDHLVGQFALGAERAKKAGFDAVEIHGGFCYLLAQFLSPYFNRRNDEYGGSMENRVRFPVRIVAAIREKVGPAYPILFRLNAKEFIDGGTTLDESRVYAKLLEQASVDLLHITAGSGFTVERHIEPMSFPQGAKTDLARAIKEVVSVPVACVGNIKEPSVAEAALERGDADCVALGRALIADPYWVRKAKSGETISRCISCNVCAGKRLAYDLPVRCSVNPLAGSETWDTGRRPAARPLKILVIGAGPGGLKAAVEAAKDGHAVTVFEREGRTGGRGWLASLPPCKEKAAWLAEDLEEQARQAGVAIRLNTPVDTALIKKESPDFVILASGTDSRIPEFFGELPAGESVLAEDLLKSGKTPSGLRIGVIGGGSVGCECAEMLAEAGNAVTLYEMREAMAADLDPVTRGDLLRRLEKSGVAFKNGHCFQRFEGRELTCTFGEDEARDVVDLLVVAAGFRKPQPLLAELAAMDIPFAAIGDALRPGRFVDATRQAYLAVARLRS